MKNQLFALRGTLPRQTEIIIEIIGFILILLIWQIIAGLSTTETRNISANNINVYAYNQQSENLNNPYVLLYNQKINNSNELDIILNELPENASLLVFTPNNYKPQADSIILKHQNKKLIFLALQNNSYNKQISAITGAAIIDSLYLTESENKQISTNLLGTVDNLTFNNDKGITFKNKVPWISNSLLPSPIEVAKSYKPLITHDKLFENIAYSMSLNLCGYIIAIIIAIPLGFLLGLFPLFRALFHRQVDALRYVPLTAVTGLFIAWFGIDSQMKVLFLAFGILVYLLPVIVQRINEVDEVYLQTAYTLGATKWQQITSVFIPAVLSKVSDDIRVLVAISWTYIIVAELVNSNSGGIGALAYKSARQSNIDKVFAILFVIIMIGFIQDRLFLLIDKLIFKHKYQTK